MDERQQIISWLNERELKLGAEQINSLLSYASLIRQYSEKLNLVSRQDLPQLMERHILDSLLALKAYDIALGARVADAGSGAGLPGIPIAIARPDLQMYLIESRRKRYLFLEKAVNSLGLTNVFVINDRWENIDPLYDIILVRAFVGESDLERIITPRLVPGGAVIYYAKFNQLKILKR